jgi:ribosomal protein L11 methyltransferase
MPEAAGRIWVRITVHCPPQAAEAIAAALLTISPNGVIVDDRGERAHVTGYMGPYLSPEATADATRRVRALEAVPEALLGGATEIEAEVVPEEDWIAVFRAHHVPVRVGQIVIKPTWEPWPSEKLPARPDDMVIEIDPGLEMQDRLRAGDRVLDFGCGSGILAIAAAKLGAGEVLGIDCDPAAIRVAVENVARNEVAESVALRELDNVDDLDPGFDLILANINPVIVAQKAAQVRELLLPGGTYICTGIPIEQEGLVLEALREAGFEQIVPRPSAEWIGFVCTVAGSDEA